MKKAACTLLALTLLLWAQMGVAAMPGPTPEPGPVSPGGVPPYVSPGRGLPAQAWMDAFVRYADAAGLPLSGSDFESVYHMQEDSYTRGMCRMEAGGAEVFLEIFDDETVVQVVVYLEGERMESPEMAEAMAAYFPLVISACVNACEESLPDTEIARILTALHPDLHAMARSWETTDVTMRPYRTIYKLASEPDFEYITFMCYWNR